jgi:hypothetical protein
VSFGEHLFTEEFLNARVNQSDDRREGVAAFVERREPRFLGR